MSEELKPCPFCGGEARGELYGHGYYVMCKDNCLHGEFCPSNEEAIKRWNTRTPYLKLKAAEDALDKICKHIVKPINGPHCLVNIDPEGIRRLAEEVLAKIRK